MKTRKTFSKIILMLLCTFCIHSCNTVKEIAYFQDAANGSTTEVTPVPITFRPQDKMSILVNNRKKELMDAYNLPYVTRYLGAESNYGTSQGVSCYTVDENGEIDFPVLGKIKVEGLTRSEVAELIKNKLITSNELQDAVVTVEFANMSIAVMGEVSKPGRYNIARDEITLLEAISLAGDLTIYGKRGNITVIRKNGDKQETYKVNLCSIEDLTSSPAYYLQQNDVVYVEPNEMRARQSTVNENNIRSTSFWISVASLLSSLYVIFIK